jgi:hypothetical protein
MFISRHISKLFLPPFLNAAIVYNSFIQAFRQKVGKVIYHEILIA